MKAIIIAGGFGTRLRPLTYSVPKPIIPLVNIPLIVHQINLLRSHGIRDIILNLHYFPEKIRETLGEGRSLGVRIVYSIEEEPLGTAGAVKNAEQFFDKGPLIILNGDVLTDLNLSKVIEFHKKKKAVATLTLAEVEDPTPFGLVLTDGKGKIKKFIEKPRWQEVVAKTINAGTYIIDPKVFKSMPKGKPYSFERDLFPGLLKAGAAMYAFVSGAFWMDIGNPEKYLQAQRAILQGDVIAKVPGHRTKEGVWWGEHCEVAKSARVHGPSLIGQACVIKSHAYLADFTVLGDRVEIGKKSKIERSIILEGGKIGDGVVVRGAILGPGCVVEEGALIGPGTVLAGQSLVKKGTRLGEIR